MKVLLVDDAAFVRMSLKKILDDMALGFEYIEAGDGEDAIEKYKIYSPDLVIMDITMPKMDGITAVGRIKEIEDYNLFINGISGKSFGCHYSRGKRFYNKTL